MLSTNALGPWLSEIIAEALGWPYAFIGCSFYSLLAVGFALLLPRTRSAPPNHRPKGTHHVGLLAAYIGSVALGIGVGSSKTFIPALLVESGAARIAPYFIAFTLGALIQRTLFGWLPDRLGHLRASGCALSLYGLSMLLVLLLDVSWVFWISVLIGIAHGMGYPAIGALAVSLGDPAARGRVTAWVTGGFNLGFAISTAGFARLEPGLGYAGLVALGGGSLLFAAVLVPALVARHERTLRRDPERIAVP
jgi:predicted MFS family arabinose efflux permease